SGPEPDPVLTAGPDGLARTRHVRAFGDSLDAVGDQPLGRRLIWFVLRGTRQRDLARHVPDRAVRNKGHHGTRPEVVTDSTALDLFDLLEQVDIDPLVIDDVAAGVRARDDIAAQLPDLLHRIDRHVAGAGHHDVEAFQGGAGRGEHLVDEVGRAVPGGLG